MHTFHFIEQATKLKEGNISILIGTFLGTTSRISSNAEPRTAAVGFKFHTLVLGSKTLSLN